MSEFSTVQKKSLTITDPEASEIGCQIKVHKEYLPVKMILSYIGAPSCKVLKEVKKLMQELYELRN